MTTEPTPSPSAPLFPLPLLVLLSVVLLSSPSSGVGAPIQSEESSDQSCVENREELLALDQQAFDQTLDGGWRPIAAKEDCELAAADLIREYRERAIGRQSEEERAESPGRFDILFWHEGQLRAIAGEPEAALPLFRQAYGEHSSPTWIPYAEATIAFLERDREALEVARNELLALEPPPDWDERVRQMKEEFDYDMTWPPNLQVVEGLLRCFDEPYGKAYGEECR